MYFRCTSFFDISNPKEYVFVENDLQLYWWCYSLLFVFVCTIYIAYWTCFHWSQSSDKVPFDAFKCYYFTLYSRYFHYFLSINVEHVFIDLKVLTRSHLMPIDIIILHYILDIFIIFPLSIINMFLLISWFWQGLVWCLQIYFNLYIRYFDYFSFVKYEHVFIDLIILTRSYLTSTNLFRFVYWIFSSFFICPYWTCFYWSHNSDKVLFDAYKWQFISYCMSYIFIIFKSSISPISHLIFYFCQVSLSDLQFSYFYLWFSYWKEKTAIWFMI